MLPKSRNESVIGLTIEHELNEPDEEGEMTPAPMPFLNSYNGKNLPA